MPDNLVKRGGVWYARIQVDGRDVRKSLRTGNLGEARKRLKATVDKLSHAKFYGEERHSWKAAVGRWTLEYLPGIKPGTANRYQVSVRQLAPWLEPLFLDEITRKKIAEIVSARLKHKVTNATVRRDLTAISSVLGCCVAWGWLEENAAALYDRKLVKEQRDPIILPQEDHIDMVIARAPGNFARMIRWAQQTGMREEECASLEHPQVSHNRKAADLWKTKTNRPRSVALSDQAVGTYAGTVRHLKSPFVFWHGGDGERYQNVASRFRQIVRSVEIEAKKKKLDFRAFRFHDLRHWHAVDYLRRGGNIYDLQRNLGHRSIKTTELYLDYLTPEEAERAKYGPAQNPAQL